MNKTREDAQILMQEIIPGFEFIPLGRCCWTCKHFREDDGDFYTLGWYCNKYRGELGSNYFDCIPGEETVNQQKNGRIVICYIGNPVGYRCSSWEESNES